MCIMEMALVFLFTFYHGKTDWSKKGNTSKESGGHKDPYQNHIKKEQKVHAVSKANRFQGGKRKDAATKWTGRILHQPAEGLLA